MISDEYHFKTKVLNLGGGFAIKYTPDDIDIDLKQLLIILFILLIAIWS